MSRRTRSTSITIKSESGERTTLRKNGTDWQIAQPATRQAGRVGEVSGITSNLSSLEVQRVIDENPSDLDRVHPRAAARGGHLQGGRQGSQAADRPEDAAGQRPLRADRRPEARRPDLRRSSTPPSTARRSTCGTRRSSRSTATRLASLAVTTPASTMRFEKNRRRVADGRSRSPRAPTSAPSKALVEPARPRCR